MVQITTTNEVAKINGVKVLVYGLAGAGKTMLVATAPKPLLISAEAGELSLKNFQIPMIKVQTMADIIEVYKWLVSSEEASQYETICLDSLSEIGEVVLADAKTRFKDARMAYGEMYERLENLVRKFRDINGKNIYMTAKCERVRDEADGCLKNAPAMPGAKLGGKLPYFFDEVFYLGVSKDTENKTFRYLQTQPSLTHMAKDRSGVLDENELPNLTKIFNKITHS